MIVPRHIHGPPGVHLRDRRELQLSGGTGRASGADPAADGCGGRRSVTAGRWRMAAIEGASADERAQRRATDLRSIPGIHDWILLIRIDRDGVRVPTREPRSGPDVNDIDLEGRDRDDRRWRRRRRDGTHGGSGADQVERSDAETTNGRQVTDEQGRRKMQCDAGTHNKRYFFPKSDGAAMSEGARRKNERCKRIERKRARSRTMEDEGATRRTSKGALGAGSTSKSFGSFRVVQGSAGFLFVVSMQGRRRRERDRRHLGRWNPGVCLVARHEWGTISRPSQTARPLGWRGVARACAWVSARAREDGSAAGGSFHRSKGGLCRSMAKGEARVGRTDRSGSSRHYSWGGSDGMMRREAEQNRMGTMAEEAEDQRSEEEFRLRTRQRWRKDREERRRCLPGRIEGSLRQNFGWRGRRPDGVCMVRY